MLLTVDPGVVHEPLTWLTVCNNPPAYVKVNALWTESVMHEIMLFE